MTGHSLPCPELTIKPVMSTTPDRSLCLDQRFSPVGLRTPSTKMTAVVITLYSDVVNVFRDSASFVSVNISTLNTTVSSV
jgi:hypothetical protein